MSILRLLFVVLASIGTIVDASLSFDSCAQTIFVKPDSPPYQPDKAISLCRHEKLGISYDVEMQNPAWSAYYITYKDVKNTIPGRLNFYPDPDVQSAGGDQPPVHSRAFESPYNHGHLAASRIMSFSEEGKHAAYTIANVAPQMINFNGQAWNDLETAVFDFIGEKMLSLYIMTGVAYKSRSSASRHYDNVADPDYYFKIVCDVENKVSAGFVGLNDDSTHDVKDNFLTVQQVEKIYGGTLFDSEMCQTSTVDPHKWWGGHIGNISDTLPLRSHRFFSRRAGK